MPQTCTNALIGKDFYDDLKDYTLHQLRGGDSFSEADHDRVVVEDHTILKRSRARFNYTTYDVRRGQDSISMRTSRADVMVASNGPNERHPFWYARVSGIFHAVVQDRDEPHRPDHRVDFLWVRWLAHDASYSGGFKKRRLHGIKFPPMDDLSFKHFGFIHPSCMIRACHVIPAFRHGRTTSLLGPSIIRPPEVVSITFTRPA